jgi:very-short-patch-repair endonuclease
MQPLDHRARELRKEQTRAEKQLWTVLRNRQIVGLKFYRQRVIGHYIADFYCPQLNLIIEADGAVHFTDEQQAYDERRNQWLTSEGFIVLRVLNTDIFNNIRGIIDYLEDLATATLPPADAGPSPFKEREAGAKSF